MSERKIERKSRRPRLDKGEHKRLLEEIALHSEHAVTPKSAAPIKPKARKPTAPFDAKKTREALAPTDAWDQLQRVELDDAHLEQNLIVTAARHDPAHGAFDVLRTRLMQTLLERKWKRVAITSPTKDCGKTFTAVNLAISLSRYDACRTVLMDMDMRNPSVAKVMGLTPPSNMGDFLQGVSGVQESLLRPENAMLNIGDTLGVMLNNRVEPYAAELMQNPQTKAALDDLHERTNPDVVLYDLPPALAYDDVIAFRAQFDGILMVVGGGTTRAEEVGEAMRRLGEDTPLLGVVLNQAEGAIEGQYGY